MQPPSSPVARSLARNPIVFNKTFGKGEGGGKGGMGSLVGVAKEGEEE